MSWRATEQQKKSCPAWVHLLGGGAGGLLGALVTSPLEVMKTRLQASRNNNALRSDFQFGLGTIRGLGTMWSQEGFFGLYRGLGAHFVGVVPSRGVHFLVYGNVKNYLETKFAPSTAWVPTVASCAAGATVVTITQPIWYIKTLLQLQTVQASETLYSGFWDVAKRTVQTEGWRGLYKGLSASYLGVFETMLQFTVYENIKNRRLASKKSKSLAETASISGSETAAISALSKLIASAITYPHEVIRTRLREQKDRKYKNAIHGLKVLAQEEGRRGLYSGMGSHLLRVVPNAAITLFTYESILSWTSKYYVSEE
jgi:solute carrier family 25 protein 33/36